jgi:methionyl-tRNA formyltransferase
MRIVMMGTGRFAEPTFEALLAGPHPVVGLVTQPDRAAGAVRAQPGAASRAALTAAATSDSAAIATRVTGSPFAGFSTVNCRVEPAGPHVPPMS